MRVGILNVTGYAGVELARLLHAHPEVSLTSVTGRSTQGEKLGQVFPHLSNIDLTIHDELGDVDFVFSALPHKASAESVMPYLDSGVRVVDISADFRLKSPEEYEQWYKVPHPGPWLLEEAVYGLTEIHRDKISSAKLVANPGCYPTSAVLGLAPLVKNGLVESDIIVDSKSGISGSGRGLSLTTHFSEVNENTMAYGVAGHRHLPEITQELGLLNSSFKPRVTFLPHIVPMTRGILSSCYATIADTGISMDDRGKRELKALYRDFYRDEPFVKVVESPPQSKQTWGNNDCLIYPMLDIRTSRAIVVSCLDNLVKGAAGQAIQNMNVMMGLPEVTALGGLAVYP